MINMTSPISKTNRRTIQNGYVISTRKGADVDDNDVYKLSEF